MNLKSIGKNIRELRMKKGLTQAQLAEKAEISTVHMSHIETGNVAMSLDSLINISNGLSVTPDSILFGEYNIQKSSVDKIISNKELDLTVDENRLIVEIAERLSELKINR